MLQGIGQKNNLQQGNNKLIIPRSREDDDDDAAVVNGQRAVLLRLRPVLLWGRREARRDDEPRGRLRRPA